MNLSFSNSISFGEFGYNIILNASLTYSLKIYLLKLFCFNAILIKLVSNKFFIDLT